jgi:hypothetical protein
MKFAVSFLVLLFAFADVGTAQQPIPAQMASPITTPIPTVTPIPTPTATPTPKATPAPTPAPTPTATPRPPSNLRILKVGRRVETQSLTAFDEGDHKVER